MGSFDETCLKQIANFHKTTEELPERVGVPQQNYFNLPQNIFQMTRLFEIMLFILFNFSLLQTGLAKTKPDSTSATAQLLRKINEETMSSGDMDMALLQYDSLIQMSFDLKDTFHLVQAASNQGELLFLLGRMDDAKASFLIGLTYSPYVEDSNFQTFNNIRLATIYKHIGQVDSAFFYLRQAEKLLPYTEMESVHYQLYNQFGLLFDAVGQGDSAVHYYLKTLSHVEDKDFYTKGAIYNNLGKSFAYRNNDEKAIEYYTKVEEIVAKDKYPKVLVSAMGNKAISLMNTGDLQSAESTIRQALMIVESRSVKRRKIIINAILARILIEQGNLKAAQEAIAQVDAMGEIKDKEYRTGYVLSKINVLLEMDDSATAEIIRLFDEAEKSIQDNYSLTDKIRFEKLRARFFEKTGDFQDSYQAMLAYNLLKDSLYKIRQSNVIHDLEISYETKNKEDRIAQMELEEQRYEARISRQRMIIGSILFALLLFGILLRYILKQNQKIKSQNAVIQKSLAEKNILLKEIHHRVKNNLQVISSLLGIQSRTIKDEAALEAITEGRTRVQTMSLIHQNLYKEDNLTGIAVQDYLGKLCQSLFDTYNINPEKVQLELDIDNLILDVESVVPIGLIMNELISNALKYAFPNQQIGKITVALKDVTEGLSLTVKDNGVGVENVEQLLEGDTFGFDLIEAFKVKLKADLNIDGSDGTHIQMLIRNFKKAA